MKLLNIIKSTKWIVAYKNKDEKKLYTVIPSSFRYCAADPFVFNHNGVNYIFAELYVYKTCRGVLGYCKLVNGKPSKWKIVIEEDFHLSYPNIFTLNGEVLICPESNENNSIYFYRATEFPDKWEKHKTLVTDLQCCDTTFFIKDDQCYGFTYSVGNDLHDLLLFRVIDGRVELSLNNPISSDVGSARPGGNVIYENGKIIRVSQDDMPYYGHGLVFSEIKLDWPNYSETVIRKVYPENISINKKLKKIGIHTYNQNDDIEVIDLLLEHISIRDILRRAISRLKRAFKN